MAKKMLIDASQPEETRVAVVQANKVEDFEFESAIRKQLKGNIYLAKVTRVEPSLQAAFVEYGGNRHGFLPLSEIHPDYYQIPQADRQALIDAEAAEEAAANREDDDNEDNGDTDNNGDDKPANKRRRRAPRRRGGRNKAKAADADGANAEATDSDNAADADAAADSPADDNAAPEVVPVPSTEMPAAEEVQAEAPAADTAEADAGAADADKDASSENGDDGKTQAAATPEDDRLTASDEEAAEANDEAAQTEDADTAATEDDAAEVEAEADSEVEAAPQSEGDTDEEEEPVEEAGSEDSVEEDIAPRRIKMRNYNIQEVIKRRQIILVQVVKEERGNKGAALTTYLSLAGRYCVLMPNTARGGGISRKITNANDRKRLKSVARELEVPQGMGLIIRTAGAQRTKAEIKRDYEYLLRLWENIRTHTLDSIAPCLIYEEGNLIQRSIRDLYSKEVDQVLVQGAAGHKQAKSFMKMLMPSHAKNVVHYEDRVPLFTRHQVESQLEQMFEPGVQLKSGGYLVINPTEALVAIDVNSGKATKEKNVEATALATNLEAAEEVARQLRLRDLAGLIVIDFIDMDEHRNRRAVERKLKEALKSDRARIQVGRISHFGLLEMSRQRLGSSLLETHAQQCEACHGTGLTRTIDAAALRAMRAVEEEAVRARASEITLTVHPDVAVYILNNKRTWLENAEQVYGIAILFKSDAQLGLSDIDLDFVKGKPNSPVPEEPANSSVISMAQTPDETPEEVADEEDVEDAETTDGNDEQADDDKPKKKRRRRRRRRNNKDTDENGDDNNGDDADASDADDTTESDNAENGVESENTEDSVADPKPQTDDAAADVDATEEPAEEEKPKPKPRRRRKPAAKADKATDDADADTDAAKADTVVADEPAKEEAPAAPVAEETVDAAPEQAAAEPEAEPEAPKQLAEPDKDRPKKRGWWQRR